MQKQREGKEEMFPDRDELRQALRVVLDLELAPPSVKSISEGETRGFEGVTFAMNGGIAMTRGGRLFAVWHDGEDGCGCRLVGTWSDDCGMTWSGIRFTVGTGSPVDFIGVTGIYLTVLVGNIWSAPDGTLRLYFSQSVNMFSGRGTLWEAICRNPDAPAPVWEQPRRIGWGSMHNKPIVLSDGSWLLPTDFERNLKAGASDPFPELESIRGCGATVSSDGGLSWRWLGRARPSGDDHFCEHSIVELADRSLLMYLRTGRGLMESRSADGGRTWTEPKLPESLRQIVARSGLIKLASGHLLVVKNGAVADRAYGQKRDMLSAFLSPDEGKSWSGGLILDERTNVSYPDLFQDADGRIYVSYDHNRNTDADEILLASFTEREVLEGKISSEGSFLARRVFAVG